MRHKKFVYLVGYGIKSAWLILNTIILICPSKAKLDEKDLFGKITRLIGPEIRKISRDGSLLACLQFAHRLTQARSLSKREFYVRF